MLERLLIAEGYNVIFDVTMGGKLGSNTTETVTDLKAAGYQIDGIFVDVTPDTSRFRVQQRHMDGLNALRTGTSDRQDETSDSAIKFGGRVVPDQVIKDSVIAEKTGDVAYNSYNAANFDKIKNSFTRWAQWDNNGTSPELVGSSATDPNDLAQMAGYYPPSTQEGAA
jgi:hypothetical protein